MELVNASVSTGWFKWVALPLLTVLLAGFVKADMRRVPDKTKNRLAVGLDVSVAAVFALAVHWGLVVTHPGTPSPVVDPLGPGMPFVLISLIVGLWAIAHLVRKYGWRTDQELNWLGVLAQDLYGLGTLGLVAGLVGGF